MLNAYFRFYDNRLGESTTGTSRYILLHQCAKVVELLDGKYMLPDKEEVDKNGKVGIGYSEKWSVVSGDTDSSYFTTSAQNQKEATLISNTIGEKVSASFPK